MRGWYESNFTHKILNREGWTKTFMPQMQTLQEPEQICFPQRERLSTIYLQSTQLSILSHRSPLHSTPWLAGLKTELDYCGLFPSRLGTEHRAIFSLLHRPVPHPNPGATSWCQPRVSLVPVKQYPLSWPQLTIHIQPEAQCALPHWIPKGLTLLPVVFNSHLNQTGLCFHRTGSKWSEWTYLSFESWAGVLREHRDGEFCVWKHGSTARELLFACEIYMSNAY